MKKTIDKLKNHFKLFFAETRNSVRSIGLGMMTLIVSTQAYALVKEEAIDAGLTYGYFYDLGNGATADLNTLDVSTQIATALSIKFSPDGTKLFILDDGDDEINQYTLSSPFDIESTVSHIGSYSPVSLPKGIAFSTDGYTLFVTNADRVYQYSLSIAFDVTSTVLQEDNYFVGSTSSVQGITFSPDGMEMYLATPGAGISATLDAVQQFHLTAPFDMVPGVTRGGYFIVTSQGGSPGDIIFNETGSKIFVLDQQTDKVSQYSLSIPFDLSGSVTFDDVFLTTTSQENTPRGMAFNGDGSRLFVVGITSDEVIGYDLNIQGFEENVANIGIVDGSLKIAIYGDTFTSAGGTLTYKTDYGILNLPVGLTPNLSVAANGLSALLTFSGTASSHQMADNVADLQFTFADNAFTGNDASVVDNAIAASSGFGIVFEDNPLLSYLGSVFTEVAANNGQVGGSATITILGDAFTNTGSALTEVSDYSITNLPSGLTPTLTVSADGLTATLTLGGSADDHEDINDISSLEFTFENSAFTSNNASIVVNATNAESGFGIDFNDKPEITYGFSGDELNDLNNTAFYEGTPYSVGVEESKPTGLVFNNDGTKMYIVGEGGDEVNQYSLTYPFDVTAGVTFDLNPLDISGQDIIPKDIAFNTDGTKMFMVGSATDAVYQYSLSNPFDITSGVTYDNVSLSITSQDESPEGIAFSPDGTKMFIIGTDGKTSPPNFDEINQYTLANPFDLTTDVTFDGSPYEVVEDHFPSDLHFNADGTKMFIIGTGNRIVTKYTLTNPYDVTTGVSFDGNSYSVIVNNPFPVSIAFNTEGDRMFILSGSTGGRRVGQYLIGAGGFEEKAKDDGSVRGSLKINIIGDSFSNPGGSLIANTDYEITNLPSGLIPNLAVAADGFSAVLTLTGSANSHADINDLVSLDFTFENSAFANVAAANITNAVGAISGLGINFISNFSAPTDLALTSSTIDENNQINDVIGTLSTVDTDAGETYIYTLVSGEGDTDNASFNIDGSDLRASEVFDFETKSSYSIHVQSNDGNGGIFSKALNLTIVNVYEAPTDIFLSTSSIAENNSVDDIIGTLTTEDEDAGEIYTYTLVAGTGDDDNASFNINGSELRASVIFDFETKDTYSVNLQSSDGNGGVITKAFTISISDDTNESVAWDGTNWSNVTGPTSDLDAVINGNYSITNNGAFEVKDLTINTGQTLTIEDGNYLTINGDLVNNGTMIVESGASLITFGVNSITGNDIIFKRNTRYADGKYSFVGSPVNLNSSIKGNNLGSYVYKYDEQVAYGASEGLDRWVDASAETLIPGKGYTQALQQEIVFVGKPNAGTVTYTGTYTEDVDNDYEGWNLISNPYPAAISVASFLIGNFGIGGAVYIWDDNGSDAGRGSNNDYIVANGTVATNTTPADGQSRYNQALGSTQGFFVKLNSSFNKNIIFSENMRVADKNSDDNFFRKAEDELSYLRINLTSQSGLFKQAVLGWLDNISDTEVDRRFDAQVFDAKSDYSIYTIKANTPLAIQGITTHKQEVMLGLNVAESGNYAIEIALENYKGQAVYLKDNVTGETVDLTLGAYTFSSNAGLFTERFVLLTASGVLALEDQETNIYAFNKILHIKTTGSQPAQYKIYNLSGVSVMKAFVNGSTQIDLSHLNNGIYIVSDGNETKKIILK